MARKVNTKDSTDKRNIKVKELLKLLAMGFVVAVAFTGAPNALIILKPFLEKKKEWEEYYPSSITRTTRVLLRKGLAKVSESKDGYVVELAEKGRTEVLKYDLENMVLEEPDKWDKKWRLVLFDIPNRFKRQREFLSKKLKSLGFYPWQESAFIYPYECSKEIKFIREVLAIAHFVKMGVLEKIENEEDIKMIFHLH